MASAKGHNSAIIGYGPLGLKSKYLTLSLDHAHCCIICIYLHLSKTSLDEPLDAKGHDSAIIGYGPLGLKSKYLTLSLDHAHCCIICIYLHLSKTSLDEPLDVHLCSYFHEQHCVTLRDVIQT